jgi:hypothetical protein
VPLLLRLHSHFPSISEVDETGEPPTHVRMCLVGIDPTLLAGITGAISPLVGIITRNEL